MIPKSGILDPGPKEMCRDTYANPAYRNPFFDEGRRSASMLEDMATALRTAESVPKPDLAKFDGVDLRLFWIRIKSAQVTNFGSGQVKLEIVSQVPDRDTGEPIQVTFAKVMPEELWSKKSERAYALRTAMQQWLLHELDEHLFVDGVRTHDPHLQPSLRIQPPPPDFEDALPSFPFRMRMP